MAEAAIIDGRYRLLRVIGVGGMGSVYEAEHVAIGRRVAIKVLHVQFSQHPDLVERLRREAQTASRIGHPNIVDVTDFGRTQDGSAYLAMEFLHGTDLGAILRERRSLPESRALSIGLQTAQALAAAHRVGVVHRDLKPENIFIVHPEDWTPPTSSSTSKIMPLARAGSPPSGAPGSQPLIMHDLVKVLDFGIAVQVGSVDVAGSPLPELPTQRAGRLTNPGLTVGTPEYMAPEQAMGSSVDARADIYAVGTLLFEMVCGRVPYVAPTTPELLTMKTEQPAPSPRVFAPAISASLEALILCCLERNPDARPQTMESVEEALQEMVTAATWAALNLAATQELPVPSQPAIPTPIPVTPSAAQTAAPPSQSPPPVVSELVGRVAVPAASSVTPPVAGISGEQLAGSSSSSGDTRIVKTPPRFSPQRRATLAIAGAAIIMIIGFWSARYMTRRAGPLPGSSTATTTTTATTATLMPTPKPPAPIKEVTPEPPAPTPVSPPPSQPGSPEEVKMLLEWARRAAAGKRFTAPPGDNLRELLDRIAVLDAENDEATALRQEAVKTLSKRLHDDLRRRHALDALESFRALHSLEPNRREGAADRATRKELIYQLLFLSRAGRRGTAREPMLLAAHGAVELAPTSAAAHLALAEALVLASRREAAAASFRRVLELKPRESEARLAEQGLRRIGKPLPEKTKHRPHRAPHR